MARTLLRAIATALGTAALVSTSVAVPVSAASATPSQSNYGSATVTTETLAGADLYATGVAISQSLSPDGGIPVVYLVSGASAADAVAAGVAAARDGGIVLYTGNSSVPAAVADELVRLNPARVEVMGGTPVMPRIHRSRTSTMKCMRPPSCRPTHTSSLDPAIE
ncbi:MAG: cell wall-binding repeat-containing protein [Candidatus Limnocylindrales bacterium]